MSKLETLQLQEKKIKDMHILSLLILIQGIVTNIQIYGIDISRNFTHKREGKVHSYFITHKIGTFFEFIF